MQGDGPSPRLYNIGEQILLFRLEYDPSVRGVYANFLVPRSIEMRDEPDPDPGQPLEGVLHDQREVFRDFDLAIHAGLTVEEDLKHTNRKVSAFADDTDGALERSSENLTYVKLILRDFGIMSGLETNVEKTTLMPIGCLDEILPDDVINLGFKIVTEIKCLGVCINNRASNLTSHFDGTIRKVRQLIGSWERYNLSLPGKIGIAKTMLISQIGYIGCIITPTEAQLNTLQDLIDGYVTRGIVLAKDRLYTKAREGGLGLIKLESYVAALQCSWIKRCS
jgi:hypothetical protein